MSAFGGVPRASVCPWARCVEAITSRSSSARQTPTATASWPIATWRKPGSSPARNRSSTFSSKRRISSISRKKSRSSSCESAPLCSTLATATEFMLRPLGLVADYDRLERSLPAEWAEARLQLTVADDARRDRAAALLGPANPGRRGKAIRLTVSRRGGGLAPNAVRRLLQRLDAERISGAVEVVGTTAAAQAAEAQGRHAPLRRQWEQALAGLPIDWSDLYAEVRFTSTDYVERAALLLAPCNPA